MSKNNFLQAFKVSVPVLFGYLALGMGFGLLLVEDGYPFWLTPIMSIFMYAGAGQYVAIGLFAANANLGMIMITELLVNIRHIVYGLSLINKFHGCGKWKPYMIFALTDETYSVLCFTEKDNAHPLTMLFISLFDHSYWIIGSVIGNLIGSGKSSNDCVQYFCRGYKVPPDSKGYQCGHDWQNDQYNLPSGT